MTGLFRGAPVATGIGSWPGTDPLVATRAVFDELAEVPGLPYLPELPGRGPGADLIGRAAGLLVDLPVDLQPSGWRLVDRPGRDLRRAVSMLGADTDALAEVADGYRGQVKVSVTGPWTLAGSLWLPRGDRVVGDPGACRDLVASLAEGVAGLIGRVRGLLAGCDVIVQLDEPALPAVLAGRLPTMSRLGRVRSVEAPVAQAGLRQVVDAGRAAGAVAVVVHCCADDPPVRVLRDCGADILSLDIARLRPAAWEGVAVAVEAGARLCAGVIDPLSAQFGTPAGSSVSQALTAIRRPWRDVGLPQAGLREVAVSPTCGLAGVSAPVARRITAHTVALAKALAEVGAD